MTAPSNSTAAGGRVNAIPAELRALPQWVCWKLVAEADGKSRKLPVMKTGAAASSTDPSTWCSYAEAVAASGRFSGVGFVFAASDPYCGIDLDHVREPETGAIEAWASDVIERLDSFAEISQSGRGVHIFVRAALPETCRHRSPKGAAEAVEIYDRGRFFCMTGNHMDGTPLTVRDRQAEIDALLSERFTDKCNGKSPSKSVSNLAWADVIDRARKYVAKMEVSISGQRGHDRAFAAAMVLIEGFALSVDQARPLFEEFSGRCDPPWSERELNHKLESAEAKADPAQRGHLLRQEGKRERRPADAAGAAVDGTGADAAIITSPDVLRMAEDFLRNYRPNLRRWNEEYYDFHDAYHSTIDDEIDADVYRFLDRAMVRTEDGLVPARKNRHTVNEIKSALIAVEKVLIGKDVQPPVWLDGRTDSDPKKLIVCRNGLINVETRKLIPNSPILFSLNRLDIEYDPKAQCDNWTAFLRELWPNDPQSIVTLQRWFGYVVAGLTWLQKMLMLYGPARGGKGTISRILTALAGPGNCCAPTLGSLVGPFGLQPLIGKTLAIVGDARIGGRSDSAVIVERLLSISGEDMTTVDRKCARSVNLRLPTRFLLLTNELPRLADAAGVFSSRLVILRLTRSWLGREDPKLADRLMEELGGILNWSLDGLADLLANRTLDQPETGSAAVDQVARLGSPVKAFVGDRCRTGPGLRIAKDDLYGAFLAYSETEGVKVFLTKEWFSRDLLAAESSVTLRRGRSDDGSRPYVYEGINLAQNPGPVRVCPGISVLRDKLSEDASTEEKQEPHKENTRTYPDHPDQSAAVPTPDNDLPKEDPANDFIPW